jgi:hypothetical protein
MYTITQHPYVATTIARQQIDERIRDAAARRAISAARTVRTNPADVVPPQPRRWWWSFVVARRSIA